MPRSQRFCSCDILVTLPELKLNAIVLPDWPHTIVNWELWFFLVPDTIAFVWIGAKKKIKLECNRPKKGCVLF